MALNRPMVQQTMLLAMIPYTVVSGYLISNNSTYLYVLDCVRVHT